MTSNITDELRAARAEVERLRAEYDGVPTYNTVCQQMHDTEQELATAHAEIERLKTRVGWLDHLDTHEGRMAHANEAVLLEIEELRMKNEDLREQLRNAARSLRDAALMCERSLRADILDNHKEVK